MISVCSKVGHLGAGPSFEEFSIHDSFAPPTNVLKKRITGD